MNLGFAGGFVYGFLFYWLYKNSVIFFEIKKLSEKQWGTCCGHVSSQKGLVRVLVLGFLFVCSMGSKCCCHEIFSCVQIFENVDNHQP